MESRKLNIVKPLFPEIGEFINEFETSLKSGQVTNNSPWVQRFEQALAEYTGVKHCAAVVNGEIALLLMLRAAGLKGSVLVPSYTFSGTVHAVMWNNLEPVFVDINPETLTIDCDDLVGKIREDTSAILAVPMYGCPCNIEELEKTADKHNIKLLFDSAPAFGSEYKGRKLGNFGLAESFSFHATKVFSTMEGGAVFTNDDEIYNKVSALRNFGQVAECDCYDFGLNGKMTEICALIGLKNLPRLDAWVKKRNELVKYFSDYVKNIPGIKLQKIPAGSVSNFLYLFIMVNPAEYGIGRDELITHFEKEEIYTRRFFCNPVHKMKSYADYSHLKLPNTDYASNNGLSLPLYSDMTFDAADRMINVLKENSK